MTANNRLAGAVLALVTTATIAFSIYSEPSEEVSRERRPTASASDATPAFSPRGLPRRGPDTSASIVASVGRSR